MDLIDFVFIAALAFIPAYVASYKGRDFIQWWFYGFLLLPIAFIHSLFLKKNAKALLETNEYKECPYCAELIQKKAIVCKHCGKDLNIQRAN